MDPLPKLLLAGLAASLLNGLLGLLLSLLLSFLNYLLGLHLGLLHNLFGFGLGLFDDLFVDGRRRGWRRSLSLSLLSLLTLLSLGLLPLSRRALALYGWLRLSTTDNDSLLVRR
jgi:hypothetical protein